VFTDLEISVFLILVNNIFGTATEKALSMETDLHLELNVNVSRTVLVTAYLAFTFPRAFL
jgi:hypothetical protein